MYLKPLSIYISNSNLFGCVYINQNHYYLICLIIFGQDMFWICFFFAGCCSIWIWIKYYHHDHNNNDNHYYFHHTIQNNSTQNTHTHLSFEIHHYHHQHQKTIKSDRSFFCSFTILTEERKMQSNLFGYTDHAVCWNENNKLSLMILLIIIMMIMINKSSDNFSKQNYHATEHLIVGISIYR